MMRLKTTKALSLFLTLAVIFTLCAPVVAFAADEPDVSISSSAPPDASSTPESIPAEPQEAPVEPKEQPLPASQNKEEEQTSSLVPADTTADLIIPADTTPDLIVPAATHTFTAPNDITENNVLASVSFSPPSPQEAGSSVIATVSLNGVATVAGAFTIDLTSEKASLSSSQKKVTVAAGENMGGKSHSFKFTVPAVDVDDMVLTFTFVTDTVAPTLKDAKPLAEKAPIAGNIVLTFSEAMDTTAGTLHMNGVPTTAGTWSESDTIYTLAYTGLNYSTKYTLALKAFKDTSGNALGDTTHAFTTITDPADIRVKDIKLDKTLETLENGKTLQLVATITPKDASNKKTTYASANAAVASVSDTGLITARGIGKTVITATTEDGKKTATCTITVVSPVSSLAFPQSSVTLEAGKGVTLKATAYTPDRTLVKVTYSTSDRTVAQVSSSGFIKSRKVGTATITAKADNGKTTTLAVNVIEKGSSVAVKKVWVTGSRTIQVGQTRTMKARTTPANAAGARITWSSNRPWTLRVDANGTITALKGGIATLTATAGGRKAVITMRVVKVATTSIRLPGESVAVGQSVTLAPIVMPLNADNAYVWTSSNPEIATINAKGVVRALKKGTTYITVRTTNNRTAKCKITVT